MIHHLKIRPEYFNAIVSGSKTFEIRKDDRPFSIGDILCLEEIDEKVFETLSYSAYTGLSCTCIVTYILRDIDGFLPEGYVCMSIKLLEVKYRE